jgi:hypothetical protein
MEMVKRYIGKQENVWTAAEEYLRGKPILVDLGEKWSETTLFPVRTARKMWVHCIHTGAAAEFLIALANENTLCAEAVVLKGEEWEIKNIMETAAVSIREVFPETTFRERRSILMDIGKVTYKALGELNQKITCNAEIEQLKVSVMIDPYQPLLDVDWIEDRMECM